MLKSDIPIPAPQQTNAYSVLDQQAREAAHAHASIHFQARPGVARPALLSQQIQEYQTVLHKAYIQFTQAPKQEIALSYAAEWILDNYYVIEQSIRQIREDLPAGYYHQLPLLSEGPHANLPRIYAVALQLTFLPGNALDTEQVQHFIRVYQDVQPLLMSELWALPIMLRISLLQRLTELVEPIALRDTGQLKPANLPTHLPTVSPWVIASPACAGSPCRIGWTSSKVSAWWSISWPTNLRGFTRTWISIRATPIAKPSKHSRVLQR